MSKLVLIGGPPGVGKSSVLPHVQQAFERSACLDADDVWRVRPFEVDETTGMIWERNVIELLRAYLDAGYPFVFLAWVLADPAKIDRILRGLDEDYGSALVVHLVASREALRERFGRKSGREGLLEYAQFKLEQIQALPYPKIDTTGLQIEAVADRIVAVVTEPDAP